MEDYYSGRQCALGIILALIIGVFFGRSDKTGELQDLRRHKALCDEIEELKAKMKYR